MAIRRRPPTPIPGPGPDICDRLFAQLSYVSGLVQEANSLLNRRSGSAYINRRPHLLFAELDAIYSSYAMDWNGVTPPWIPPICRGVYRSLMTLRREGLWMLYMVRGQADQYVGTKKIVDGFTINRPHNKRMQLVKMMTT